MSDLLHAESSRKRCRSYPPSDCSSSSCPSSGSRSLIALGEEVDDIKWKGMYQESERKNTELSLQLCFVRSECLRLLRVQNDMAQSITTLQSSMSEWIKSITSDNEDEDDDDEEEEEDDDSPKVTQNGTRVIEGDSDTLTDEEDCTSKRRRMLIHSASSSSSSSHAASGAHRKESTR